MIALVLTIAASLVLAIATRKRPIIWLGTGVVCLVLVPRVASRSWYIGAGDFASIHPSMWVFVGGVGVTILSIRRNPNYPRSRKRLNVALALWVLLSLLIVVIAWGNPSSFLFVFVAPLAGFFAVGVAAVRANERIVPQLVQLVLVLAVLQAALAIAQWATGQVLFWETFYSSNYWWRTTLSRSLGTLDSPLDLAAFLTMALPLIARLRRTSMAIAVAALLLAGVFVSGSRVGTVVAVVVLVWVLITHSRHVIVGTLIGVLLVASAISFLATPLADELLDRFGARGDTSTEVRRVALDTGLGFVMQSPLFGHGTGFAYDFSSSQLSSSFENAYLSAAIDYGLPIVASLVALQVLASLCAPHSRLLYRLPGLIAILWGFSYSAFASGSAFGTLAWLFIGISSVSGLLEPEGRAGSGITRDLGGSVRGRG